MMDPEPTAQLSNANNTMSEMYPNFRTAPLGAIFLKLSRQLTAQIIIHQARCCT
jgi:hypothetical protein